jgi:hypothetical protein
MRSSRNVADHLVRGTGLLVAVAMAGLVSACAADAPPVPVAELPLSTIDDRRLSIEEPEQTLVVFVAWPLGGESGNQVTVAKSMALQHPELAVILADGIGDAAADTLRNAQFDLETGGRLSVLADSETLRTRLAVTSTPSIFLFDDSGEVIVERRDGVLLAQDLSPYLE